MPLVYRQMIAHPAGIYIASMAIGCFLVRYEWGKSPMNVDDPGRAQRKINNFGSLRLIFASLVIVSHSPELIDGDRSREILTQIFGTLSFGQIAVDGFFLVSGYLIIQSYQNSKSVGDYLIKRIFRIYPGFIVAFIISTLVVGVMAGGDIRQISPPWEIAKLILLGLPKVPGAFSGLPHPELNGSLWTIAYEFRCYLLVILFGKLASSRHRAGYAVVLIILAGLYAEHESVANVHFGEAVLGNMVGSIRFAFIFFVGGAFYVWRDRIELTNRGAILSALALSALMFSPRMAEPAFALFGGYLIFWYTFKCRTNAISHTVDHIDPSYGLYLYAWPIQNLMIFHYPGISPWAVSAITLPLALFFGVSSWFLIEKPALGFKRYFAGATVRRMEANSRTA